MGNAATSWLLQKSSGLLGCRAQGPGDDPASLQALGAFVGGGCSSIVVSTKQLAAAPPIGPAAGEVAHAGAPATPDDSQQGGAESQEEQQQEESGSTEPAPQLAAATQAAAVLCAYAQPFPASLQGRPCVHFARRGTQLLTVAELEAAVTYTLLPSGPTVDSLRQVLLHVFSPWLARQSAGAAAPGGGKATPLGELLLATQKFGWQLEQAMRQLRTKQQLPVPQGVDLSDPEAAARSEEALAVCEQVEEQWVRLITSTLQQEGQRVPQGRGPLAELTFWQERSAVYSSLYEQLSLPVVRAVQAVVERGSMDHNLVASFKTQLGDLTRLTLEARDNVKFLLTLERHFKNIEAGPLAAVADTLGPMLNGLRMIWIISRYYGDDVRMSNLLERIAVGLQDRLRGAVDVRSLFRSPSASSIQLVKTCKAIADGWCTTYMQMRAKIEESGHDARWEFSKQLLFEQTNYAAEVCGELLGMLEAVDDFQKFLGPDLKAVTGDASVVDEVARMVQAMIAPVEGAAFCVMDKAHGVEWKGIRLRFQRDAEEVKLATRDLIDTCFRKLRSVEAAARLLQSFQRIQTQGAIQRQMNQKLADVLDHFVKEVDMVRKVFEDSKDNPPLTRNMPPVAGAIRWARGLFGKIKRTMGRLQSLEADLEATEPGQRAVAACKDLARVMLQYEKQCYETWRATAEHIATSSLQQPVLCREAPPEDAYLSAPMPHGPGRLAINFAPALLRLVREAKYLDQLGFSVPEAVVNAALQERRLRAHVEELRALLEHYYKAVDGLHSAERALLADHLERLEGVLAPGLGRINWNSLSISDFAAGADKAVEEFEVLVAQILKNTTMIEKVLQQISRGPLVPPDAAAALAESAGAAARAAAGGGEEGSGGSGGGSTAGAVAAAPQVPDMPEFYEHYEQFRLQAMEGLVTKYRSMTPLLLKVEELVAGTSSGKSPRLAAYYAYWERRVFAAVNAMVLGAIDAVHGRLRACATDASKPPVLMITLSLIQPEVVLAPSPGEVIKQVSRLCRNLAESSKAFVRWMDGTCLECPEQYVFGEDSEPFVFSFFQDVSQSPAVIKAMLAVNHTVQKAATALNKYVEGWRRYGSLWKTDRAALLAKFKARRPSHAVYEQRLSQYQRIVEDVGEMSASSDVEFVRVNCAPLLGTIRSEAQAWLRDLAGAMQAQDAPACQAWEAHLASLRQAAQLVPASESEIAQVKEALAVALASAADAEVACADLEERARTRLLCAAGGDLGPLQADLDSACQLRVAWQDLAAFATNRQQQPIEVPLPEAVVDSGTAQLPDGLSSAAGSTPALSRQPSAMSGPRPGLQPAAAPVKRASSSSASASSPRGAGPQSRGSTAASEAGALLEQRRGSGASSRAGGATGGRSATPVAGGARSSRAAATPVPAEPGNNDGA